MRQILTLATAITTATIAPHQSRCVCPQKLGCSSRGVSLGECHVGDDTPRIIVDAHVEGQRRPMPRYGTHITHLFLQGTHRRSSTPPSTRLVRFSKNVYAVHTRSPMNNAIDHIVRVSHNKKVNWYQVRHTKYIAGRHFPGRGDPLVVPFSPKCTPSADHGSAELFV